VIEVATDLDSSVAHWTTHSFIDPGSVWRQDLAELDQGATLVRRTSLAVDLGDLVSEQVFVTSDDGTRVPVFLTRRADVVADGEVPVLLYGYGGFNIAITPTFSPQWALWVRRGGLLAVACLRGGGEYGTAWYDGGRLANKPNVAALQSALPSGSRPALLRVDIDAGHGAGKPTAKSIAEKADVLAFLDHTVGGGG